MLEEAYPLKVAWRMWGWTGSPFTLDPEFYRYPSLVTDLDFLAIGAVRAVLEASPDAARSLDSFDCMLPAIRRPSTSRPPAHRRARRLTVVPPWRLARAAGGPTAADRRLLLAINPLHVLQSS